MTRADQQRGLITEEEKKVLAPVLTTKTSNLRRLKEMSSIENGKGKPEPAPQK